MTLRPLLFIAGIMIVGGFLHLTGLSHPRQGLREIQVPTQADIAAVEGTSAAPAAAAEARPASELEAEIARLKREIVAFQTRTAELEKTLSGYQKDLAGYQQSSNPVAREIGLWLNRHAAQHDQERRALRALLSSSIYGKIQPEDVQRDLKAAIRALQD